MGRARGQKREFCVLLAIEREAPGAILLVAVRTAYDSYRYGVMSNDTGAR